MTIETTSRNFNRTAVIETPVAHGVRTDWVTIGQGQIRLIDFRGYHNKDLAIVFPEHREQEYRIVIHNEDNPPLRITGVKARGNAYRAVFLAAADEPYRVYYGSEQVAQPKYDLEAVLLPLRQGGNAVSAALGSQVANPAAGAEAGDLTARRLLNNPLVLGILVFVLVVVLGWALFPCVAEDRTIAQRSGNVRPLAVRPSHLPAISFVCQEIPFRPTSPPRTGLHGHGVPAPRRRFCLLHSLGGLLLAIKARGIAAGRLRQAEMIPVGARCARLTLHS